MTVKELRDKLSLYKDDVDIYITSYDDIHGINYLIDFNVNQSDVYYGTNRKGHSHHCTVRYFFKTDIKQDTVLIIE